MKNFQKLVLVTLVCGASLSAFADKPADQSKALMKHFLAAVQSKKTVEVFVKNECDSGVAADLRIQRFNGLTQYAPFKIVKFKTATAKEVSVDAVDKNGVKVMIKIEVAPGKIAKLAKLIIDQGGPAH